MVKAWKLPLYLGVSFKFVCVFPSCITVKKISQDAI